MRAGPSSTRRRVQHRPGSCSQPTSGRSGTPGSCAPSAARDPGRSPATAGRQVQRGEPSRQPPALPNQPPPPTQTNTGRRLATAGRQPRGMAAAVPRTASRPSRTARTDNGPDLTVKARSQPEPTRSTEPDYLRAGIHAEDAAVSVPESALGVPDHRTAGYALGSE